MRRIFRHLGRAHGTLVELWKASPVYRWTLLLSLLLVVGTAALPAWRLLPAIQEEQFIPLHMNVYFGIDRYGPWYGIFLPAGLGLAFLILNTIFEGMFFRSEKLIALCFAWGTVAIQTILLTATFFIVLLNV